MVYCPNQCGLTGGCSACRGEVKITDGWKGSPGHYVGDDCPGGHADEAQVAFKFDAGKLRYDLIPTYPLKELAKVYTDGAAKYGDENYLKEGMNWKRVIASLLRHVEAYRACEDLDPESGSHHLAHAAWCCFTLLTYQYLGLGEDDR